MPRRPKRRSAGFVVGFLGGVGVELLFVNSFLFGGGVFRKRGWARLAGGRGRDIDGETTGVFEDAFQQRSRGGPSVVVLTVDNKDAEAVGGGAEARSEKERERDQK